MYTCIYDVYTCIDVHVYILQLSMCKCICSEGLESSSSPQLCPPRHQARQHYEVWHSWWQVSLSTCTVHCTCTTLHRKLMCSMLKDQCTCISYVYVTYMYLHLISCSYIFKLADFGTARELRADETFISLHGTEEYLYPGMYERALVNPSKRHQFSAQVRILLL